MLYKVPLFNELDFTEIRFMRFSISVAIEMDRKLDATLNEVNASGQKGQDGPMTAVYKEEANRLKAIQQKYHFLFTDD